MEESTLSGERLRNMRERLHWSQGKLADEVAKLQDEFPNLRTRKNGRCSTNQVSRHEKDGVLSSWKYAELYGKALGVNPDYLLCKADFPTPDVEKVAGMICRFRSRKHQEKAFDGLLEAMGLSCELKCSEPNAFKPWNDLSDSERESIDYGAIWLSPYAIKDEDGETLRLISREERDRIITEIFDFSQFTIEKLLKGEYNGISEEEIQ